MSKKIIKGTAYKICPRCDGSGMDTMRDLAPNKCTQCGGRKYVYDRDSEVTIEVKRRD